MPSNQPIFINSKPVHVNSSKPSETFGQPQQTTSNLIHIEKPSNSPFITPISQNSPHHYQYKPPNPQPPKVEIKHNNWSNYELFKHTAELNSHPEHKGNNYTTYTPVNPQPTNWTTGTNEATKWTGWKGESNKEEWNKEKEWNREGKEENRSDDILKRIDAVLAQSRNNNF